MNKPSHTHLDLHYRIFVWSDSENLCFIHFSVKHRSLIHVLNLNVDLKIVREKKRQI